MKKNTTLLMKIFELGKMPKPAFRAIAPLFQITAYRADTKKPLSQILHNPKLTYTPLKTSFNRILILTSNQASNARRSVFINTKRNDLIQYFDRNGQSDMVYVLFLFQINQFVPTEFLVEQIDCVIKQRMGRQGGRKMGEAGGNRVLYFRDHVLFPFNLREWKTALHSSFPKSPQVKSQQLQQSYFFMQLTNLHMLQFALNPQLLYKDLKDFDSFLNKFNFIRFFWQCNPNNQFIARKYAERLIKTIRWRAGQSQEYLLMLIRANGWERFGLLVQDFCLCYEYLNGMKGQSNGKEPASAVQDKTK